MPKFRYHLTNGKTLVFEGESAPSDAEVEQQAKAQGVSLVGADDGELAKLDASKKTLAAANAKPLQADTKGNIVSRFADTPIGSTVFRLLDAYDTHGRGNVVAGAKDVAAGNLKKGAHELLTGAGVASAPVLLPVSVATAGIPATIGGLAGGALAGTAGNAVAKGLGADEDTANLVGDAAGIVGGAAGGKGAAKLWESAPGRGAVLNIVKETARTGAPLKATAKEVAGHVLKTMAPEEAATVAAPKLTAKQAAAAAEQARLETAGVTPVADTAASNPSADTGAMSAYRVPYTAEPAQPPVSSKVTSLADMASSNAETAMPEPTRVPYEAPKPQPAKVKTPAAPITKQTQLEGFEMPATPETPLGPRVGLEAQLSPEEQAIIGNRGAGALTLAQRKAALDAFVRDAAKRLMNNETGAMYIGNEPRAGRITFEDSPRMRELKAIFGDGGLDSLASLAPGSAAQALDSRISGLPPGETPAPTISGPQGVPASAQTENIMRALLSKAALSGE